MVEYHGWATLRESTHDLDAGGLNLIASAVTNEIVRIAGTHRVAEMRALNGEHLVLLAGVTNHRSSDVEEAIDLFRFIATLAPGSYGLLYIWDDETPPASNEFRVWRLARGQLTEHADPFLSPCIPAIEDAYDPLRDTD